MDKSEFAMQNSMDFWLPKIKGLSGVKTPKTVKVQMYDDGEHHRKWCEKEKLVKAVEQLGGTPVFLRTDQASNKHSMKTASKVSDKKDVMSNLLEVVSFNEAAGFFGLPYETIYVREWLRLEHNFKAFKGTPIAQELRFFINDGEVLGHHFYWPKESIKFFASQEEPDNWEEKWRETRNRALEEAPIVRKKAFKAAQELDGFWSIDFAKTKMGRWYLIDAARGEMSWHPEVDKYCGEKFNAEKYVRQYR